jgi:hypothetical protein
VLLTSITGRTKPTQQNAAEITPPRTLSAPIWPSSPAITQAMTSSATKA